MTKLAILVFLFGITLARPRWSLYLMLLCAPLISVYQSVGWDLRLWLTLFLGIRVILTADGKRIGRNITLIVASVLYFAIAELVLLVRSSVVPSEDASSAQQALIYFLAGALFAFAASQLLRNKLHLSRALISVAIAVAYTTGYALWQKFFPSSVEQLRIASTLINPNALGAYASLCAITQLTARRWVDKRSWRIFIAAAVLLSVTAVALSLSRGAMVALTPALVLLWASRGGKTNVKRIFAAVAVSVLMIATLVTTIRGFRVESGGGDPATQRRTDISQALEDYTRYEAATYSLEQWRAHPLFGVGFMLFPAINYQETGFNATTHNTLLQLLAGTGLVGIALLALVASQLWKKLSRQARFIFLPVVVCFFVNCLFGDLAHTLEVTSVISIAYFVVKRMQETGDNVETKRISRAVTF